MAFTRDEFPDWRIVVLDPARQVGIQTDFSHMNTTLVILATLLVVAALGLLALTRVALGIKLISRPCKVGSVNIGALEHSTHIDQRDRGAPIG